MTSAAILGCLGPRLHPNERAFFAEAQPLGFILFSRNIETPDQTLRLTDALRDAVGWEAPILVDQEGGRVQRMGPPVWRQWLPPLDQVALAGPASMELRSRIIAHELRAVGIDVNCAPLGDIADPCTHAFLKNRCYGMDVETVLAACRAVIAGFRAGGVLPVLKHIPGHGRSVVDSHLDLPVVADPIETLLEKDFAPFQAMCDVHLGMTAHLIYTSLDPDRPATQSPRVIDTIRRTIGFQGLLMTDDISMEALQGGVATRSAASIAAGCDAVLHCNGDLAEMQEVVAAVGALSPDGEGRLQAALAERRAPEPIDIAALDKAFAELMREASAAQTASS